MFKDLNQVLFLLFLGTLQWKASALILLFRIWSLQIILVRWSFSKAHHQKERGFFLSIIKILFSSSNLSQFHKQKIFLAKLFRLIVKLLLYFEDSFEISFFHFRIPALFVNNLSLVAKLFLPIIKLLKWLTFPKCQNLSQKKVNSLDLQLHL